MNKTGPWLWLADIKPATLPDWIERHASGFSASEQARLQRISRPERRTQFLAGHVLLRRLVAARSGVAAAQVRIESQRDGRPDLLEPAGWRPSLAHSRQWVAALLVANGDGPGVDIEFMQPTRQIQTIVKLACSVDAESREHAYLVWAQREAELKASTNPPETWVTTWSGHALAVCAKGPPEAALLDLARDGPAVTLGLDWTKRPPISVAELAHGR